MQEQNHPLYQTDRELVNGLLVKDSPGDRDLVDLARLLLRYEGFPGADDLKADMHKILTSWNITPESLNAQTRKIWEEGFRPDRKLDESVGSGFDTADDQGN